MWSAGKTLPLSSADCRYLWAGVDQVQDRARVRIRRPDGRLRETVPDCYVLGVLMQGSTQAAYEIRFDATQEYLEGAPG